MRTTLLAILCFACVVHVGRAEGTWSGYFYTNRYDFTISAAALTQTPVLERERRTTTTRSS